MYLFLLEPQNIITQDHDQGQEKENESQTMKEENTGAGAEAKSVLMREETELKTLQTQIAK